jgi:hypothetical protein
VLADTSAIKNVVVDTVLVGFDEELREASQQEYL